jgi:tripartite-type tricarboxylate transporter receptor subunit TctC
MLRCVMLALLGAALAFPTASIAETWPSRPVTMVVPFAAGGIGDVLGRILAARLSELLGQQVIVENVGGAGGMAGSARVANATPDGYTFVLGSSGTHAQNQLLYKKPLYNAETDFAPVALVVEQPVVLITRKDLPVENLHDFIAYAKANAAKMQFGSPGTGSAMHLGCSMLDAAMGVTVTHIPYRGGGPALQDLLAGRIDYMCTGSTNVLPQLATHAVKPLAVLSLTRTPTLPDIPTADEQGLTKFEAPLWWAIFMPKGTPPAIVHQLNDALVSAMNTPEVQERLKITGFDIVAPDRRSPEYLQKFVASQIEKWSGPIKAAGLAGIQ